MVQIEIVHTHPLSHVTESAVFHRLPAEVNAFLAAAWEKWPGSVAIYTPLELCS